MTGICTIFRHRWAHIKCPPRSPYRQYAFQEHLHSIMDDNNGTSVREQLIFSITDYALFSLMLALSALIGVYFGCFGKKQNTKSEYLHGGKTMGVIPVSMSLVASHVSGVTLLGVPADVYLYGTAYWMCCLSGAIVSVVVAYVYLPVFYKIQVTSSFEYLQRRFDSRIRLLTSFLYIVSMLLFIPIVIYIPALAFSQVTGANIHAITPIVCVVCIFYTTLGGLKAVVWTDTLQFVVTVTAMVTVLAMGINTMGGVENIWQKSNEGDRLDFFNMDPSLSSRCTFWGISVGLTISWIAYLGVNQGSIQKFLSVPTLGDARCSLFVFSIGLVLVKSISCFTGLIMYAKYVGCDPMTAGVVKRADQLLPYYVMDVAGGIPGIPGLFVAGVFSTALSTMSAALNTVAGTMYEDFIMPVLPRNVSEARASGIMKVSVVVLGAVCTALVVVVDKLGGILQLSITLSSVTTGPLLGLFSLGILFPWATSRGAWFGGITSIAVITWIVVGSQYHFANGGLKYPHLNLTTEECEFNVTVPTTASILVNATRSDDADDDIFFLYKLSYMFYSALGAFIVMIVGIFVSLVTGTQDLEELDPDLITPILHFLIPKSLEMKFKRQYQTVDQADMILESKT